MAENMNVGVEVGTVVEEETNREMQNKMLGEVSCGEPEIKAIDERAFEAEIKDRENDESAKIECERPASGQTETEVLRECNMELAVTGSGSNIENEIGIKKDDKKKQYEIEIQIEDRGVVESEIENKKNISREDDNNAETNTEIEQNSENLFRHDVYIEKTNGRETETSKPEVIEKQADEENVEEVKAEMSREENGTESAFEESIWELLDKEFDKAFEKKSGKGVNRGIKRKIKIGVNNAKRKDIVDEIIISSDDDEPVIIGEYVYDKEFEEKYLAWYDKKVEEGVLRVPSMMEQHMDLRAMAHSMDMMVKYKVSSWHNVHEGVIVIDDSDDDQAND